MKNCFFLIGLTFVSLLGLSNAYANKDNNTDIDPQTPTITTEKADEAKAYIKDVTYDLDKGIITVTAGIKNMKPNSTYRVKITPTNQITGVVVEGSLFYNIDRVNNSGVKFHCYSGKESDAPYCRAYTFNAEIVDEW